jgi:transcription antitermination protein NusB
MAEPGGRAMSKRRNAREMALKILFQIDVGKLPPDEVLEIALEQVPLERDEEVYVTGVVGGTLDHLPELDEAIASLASGWSLDRIANVDKNVLRLAMYEISYRDDIPPSVSVNEAVEMAKKYSTEDSGRFVNGILGAYLRRHTTVAADQTSDDSAL